MKIIKKSFVYEKAKYNLKNIVIHDIVVQVKNIREDMVI